MKCNNEEELKKCPITPEKLKQLLDDLERITQYTDIHNAALNIIANNCYYPDITSVKVTINDTELKSDDYIESDFKQTSVILVEETEAGSVEISYLSERYGSCEPQGLSQDKVLLDTVGKIVSNILHQENGKDFLIDSTLKLQALLDGLPFDLMEFDKEMRCIWANKAILTRIPDIIGKVCYKANHQRISPCEGCPCYPMLFTSRSERNVVRCPRTVGISGESFWDVIAVPIKNENGDIIGGMEIASDVTKRVELYEIARQNYHLALVGQLAAGVAHEINNPLTAVVAVAELLLDADVPEELKKNISLIHTGAQRVSSIVRRLLTFSRQQKRNISVANVNDIIRSALDFAENSLKQSDIEVVTSLSDELPEIAMDKNQIEEVFLNIILNAKAAIESAGVRGRLVVTSKVKNNMIRISFKDNGTGIDESCIDKLFNPFFSTKTVGEGSGLGLSISHGIISEHDGIMYAENHRSGGAVFVVELPIVQDLSQQLEEELVESYPELPDFHQANILVVDDDPLVAKCLSQVLSEHNCQVTTVNSSRRAVFSVMNNDFDALLIDVKLSKESGIDLYNTIREIKSYMSDRVVFMTGDIVGTNTLGILAEYGVPYVIKPIRRQALIEQITRVLGKPGTRNHAS